MTAPAAWLHHYRRISGGSTYSQANLGGGTRLESPIPAVGYEWTGSEPLYSDEQYIGADFLPAANALFAQEANSEFLSDAVLYHTV